MWIALVKVHYSSLRPFTYRNVSGTYAYTTSDKLTCEYMSEGISGYLGSWFTYEKDLYVYLRTWVESGSGSFTWTTENFIGPYLRRNHLRGVDARFWRPSARFGLRDRKIGEWIHFLNGPVSIHKRGDSICRGHCCSFWGQTVMVYR